VACHLGDRLGFLFAVSTEAVADPHGMPPFSPDHDRLELSEPRDAPVTHRRLGSAVFQGAAETCVLALRAHAGRPRPSGRSLQARRADVDAPDRPPRIDTWPTPLVDSIWRHRALSANSVARGSAACSRARSRIGVASGPADDRRVDALGRSRQHPVTLSRTLGGGVTFFSSLNVTNTCEMPSAEVDQLVDADDRVDRLSILSVISVSTSSGAARQEA
jgi:hypothetical protein